MYAQVKEVALLKRKRQMTAFEVEVKKRLLDRGMTQTELADRLGIRKQYLILIFSGKRKNSRYVGRIKEILDMSA